MSAIFQPIFKGEYYIGHECSECHKRIKFAKYSTFGFFGTDIRFCPYCAADIIQFSNTPKFEEPLDVSVLEPITKVITFNEEKIKYIYWCCFTEEQREKCKTIFKLTNHYSNIQRIVYYKPHFTAIKKLKQKFENEVTE